MSDSIAVQPVSCPVEGIVSVPGSKSITNRALLLAALANGRSYLRNALFSDDTRYMSTALRTLGIGVEEDETQETFSVQGCGGCIPESQADLFIGNAGTAARFLTAFVSLGHGTYRLDGVERMRQRPIEDLLQGLRQLGVDATSDRGNGCLPLTIHAGGISGGKLRLSANVSSQYPTALLLVSPLAESDVEIELTGELASRPYVEMTLRMIEQWGASVEYLDNFTRFRIPSGQAYRAQEYTIEPDASSASYFFAAAALSGGSVTVPGIGSQSLQGDARFVEILEEMGCDVKRDPESTSVRGALRLSGVDVDMNGISDTVMTLAAIAPFADSATTIRNVAHIRHKETDRIRALANELTRLGVKVEERNDGLTIHPAREMKPAEIETYDDHRMAMSFAITGLRSPGISIKNPACVSKTFPDFFARLEALVHPNP